MRSIRKFAQSALVMGATLSLCPFSATAVGFREISAHGVSFGVWYPSDAATSTQRLGPFEVDVAKDAPVQSGTHGIILFSHGNSGFYRNHYLTSQALADAGFVVIAPQHEADYLVGGRKTAAALNHRYLELSKALTAVLGDPDFAQHVDPQDINGLGFSLGGATILLAAGAGFSSERAVNHCNANGKADMAFCEDPSMIYRLIQSFRHDVDLPDTSDPFRNQPLIDGKTVLVAPVFQGIDLTQAISTSELTVFAITGDKVAIPEFHARPLFDTVSDDLPSAYHIIPGHHFAFIAPFPKWLTDQEDIPVAKDPEGFDRRKFLDTINASIVRTFMQN